MLILLTRIATLASLAFALRAEPVAAQAVSSRTPGRDETAIRAVLDSTAAGWNRGDLSRYLWAYDDSLTALGATGMERGRATLEASMRAGFWKTGRPLQQLRYDHVDVRMLGADYALVTGQFVLTATGRPDRTGWFTTVWARTKAGWRMIHD